MKNLKIALSGILAIAMFTMMSFKTSTTNPSDDVVKPDFKKVTFADLKAKYGSEIYDQEGNKIVMELTEEIQFSASMNTQNAGPCGDFPQCGMEAAYINGVLRPQAEACCCSFTYGVECCRQGSLVAILYLISPRNPNCN